MSRIIDELIFLNSLNINGKKSSTQTSETISEIPEKFLPSSDNDHLKNDPEFIQSVINFFQKLAH